MTTEYIPWRHKSLALASKGSMHSGPGSLAGLAAARREHEGQFFTPDAVVGLVWTILGSLAVPDRLLSIMDSSCGNGALLGPANPERHAIYGIDPDERCTRALDADRIAAGFSGSIVTATMQNMRWSGADVALINPPFSLHLVSASMNPYGSTSYGPFGPHTSATSHWYALDQALAGAKVVIAILPASIEGYLAERADLAAHCGALIRLGSHAFREEGVDFGITIGVFSSAWNTTAQVLDWGPLATVPDLPEVDFPRRFPSVQMRSTDIPLGDVRITRPASGDCRVRLVRRSGSRRLRLVFQCGAMEARFLNALLISDVGENVKNKRPHWITYQGQGALDIERFLGMPDPLASLEGHYQAIAARVGADLIIDPSLAGFLRRAGRRRAVLATPFRHVVRGGAADSGMVTVIKSKALTNQFGGPRLRAGIDVPAQRVTGGWLVTLGDVDYRLTDAEAACHLRLPERQDHGWRVVHAGKAERFPGLRQSWERRAAASGAADWVSWGFQSRDTVELLINGCGIAGWEMGLGKTRLSLALCAMRGGKRNLIVIPAHLVDEFEQEIAGLGIPDEEWQVIRTVKQAKNLRRFNLITYNRLRSSLARCPDEQQREATKDPRWPSKTALAHTPAMRACQRMTMARFLRHRICTLVCDEVHALRDRSSRQSRAIAMVSPKHRYGLTGTPAANYPRDVLPLVEWIGGDGTSIAPYGYRLPYHDSWTPRTAYTALKGQDVALDTLMTFEWVTNEFSEDLTKGAKREVPKIRNVAAFRELVAPHILRRVVAEPEVAEHFHIPPYRIEQVEVSFTNDHLEGYLNVAFDFADWYRRAHEHYGRKLNMITTLARVGAVERMLNMPQVPQADGRFYGGSSLSAKESYAVARAQEWAAGGHKTVIFCSHPHTADLLVSSLIERGVSAIPYHGNISIGKRTQRLNSEFRKGDASVLVATIGSAQTGLNLWQASRCLVINRPWTPTAERQAIARLLRPQQKREVLVEVVNIEGSLDEYQGQMIAHKNAASTDGFDYGDEQGELGDFEHLDTLLNRFVADLAIAQGMSWSDFVQMRRSGGLRA